MPRIIAISQSLHPVRTPSAAQTPAQTPHRQRLLSSSAREQCAAVQAPIMTTKESMDELRKAAEAQMRRLAPDDGLAPAKRQRKGAPSHMEGCDAPSALPARSLAAPLTMNTPHPSPPRQRPGNRWLCRGRGRFGHGRRPLRLQRGGPALLRLPELPGHLQHAQVRPGAAALHCTAVLHGCTAASTHLISC